MKRFENMGFTAIVTNDKLKLEIPISGLVSGFEGNENNYDETTIKRGKRRQFSEWVAEHIIDEHDSETGASYIAEAFDGVFNLILEGYETCDEFVKYGEEM